MTKFKKGDRVRVVSVDVWDYSFDIQVGDEGTVVDVIRGLIGVRMDGYNKNLHDCSGCCEEGHGKRFDADQLELIENETPEPLENWKHPYYGKPILVRNYEEDGWQEQIFESYCPHFVAPIMSKNKFGVINPYRYYKFPDPETKVPEYTMEELTEKLGHEFKIKK